MPKIQITQTEHSKLRTLMYHVMTADIAEKMTALRAQYFQLGLDVLRSQVPSRSHSIALTHLEESLMRAIQGLALTGIPELPMGYEVIADNGASPAPHTLPS